MSTRLAASPDAYRESAVLTASNSKERLVVMLYDDACRSLEQGAMAMREGDMGATHVKLRRGEAIISHLQHTLGMQQGDIAKNLLTIYLFCHRHLNRARIERDPGKVEEVVGLLRQLSAPTARRTLRPVAAAPPAMIHWQSPASPAAGSIWIASEAREAAECMIGRGMSDRCSRSRSASATCRSARSAPRNEARSRGGS